jgi:hypothetical protein
MKTNGNPEAVARITRRTAVLAALLAVTFSATGTSRAQSSAAPLPRQDAKPLPQPSSQGAREGITAHGYWIIEVRNPDGKLSKHMEFENQLCTAFTDPASGASVPGGDSTLAGLLTDSQVPGAWSIVLGTQELVQLPGGPPFGGGFVPGPNCAIFSQFSLAQTGVQGGSSAIAAAVVPGVSGAGAPAFSQLVPFAFTCSANCFSTLTATSPAPSTINLSGQFTVPEGNPVNISAVGTDLFTCPTFTFIAPPNASNFCGSAGNMFGTHVGQIVASPSSNACQVTETQSSTFGVRNTQPWAAIFEYCFPGPESAVAMTTYSVAGQSGRSPFSGAVLTGTNGIPAAFTVNPGQTVSVNWTLSFQ